MLLYSFYFFNFEGGPHYEPQAGFLGLPQSHGLGIKRQTQPYLTVSTRLPGASFSEELTLGYLLLKVDRFSADCTLG